jgi:hypothetical protein
VWELPTTLKGAPISKDLTFPRLIADARGGSRFDSITVPLTLQNFAPPASPFSVSTLAPATQCGFLHLPANWVGEMHPSPLRMWIFVLQGEMHFEASNGEWRSLAPGSAVLLEDTQGVGHFSKVLGHQAAVLAVTGLPDVVPKNAVY